MCYIVRIFWKKHSLNVSLNKARLLISSILLILTEHGTKLCSFVSREKVQVGREDIQQFRVSWKTLNEFISTKNTGRETGGNESEKRDEPDMPR